MLSAMKICYIVIFGGQKAMSFLKPVRFSAVGRFVDCQNGTLLVNVIA